MNKKLLIRILQITVVLALLEIFLFMSLGIDVFSMKGISKIPTIISSIVLFWIFYFSWGWKIPYLRKLAYKENLNGTWFGTYKSKNFTSESEFNGEIVLVIRQSFIMLNVKSFTDKYINYSYGEVMNYDSNSDSHQLLYLYSQSEIKPTNDNIRKGTSELHLHYNCDKKELYGNFWTNHNSKGYLNLTKTSKKKVKSFAEAQTLNRTE